MTAHRQTTDGVEYTTGYTYNLSGALIEESYPSGRVVKNTLDASGDLQQVQSKRANDTFRNYANGFNYTSAGAVSSLRLGNGRWENTTFNSRLQSVQIGLGTSVASQNLLKLNYDYGTNDNNRNVLSQQITVQRSNQSPLVFTQSYVYGSLNRLKSAEEKDAANVTTWRQTYTFDRYGNRRFDQSNTTFPASFSNPNVTNPQIDATNNRFTTGQGWTYDLAGNVITDAEGRSFTYDAENKQVAATNASSATLGTYYFDGDGKRVKKIVPGTGEVTIFVYDAGAKLIAEYSTVVAPVENAKVAYLTADHLGSPRINTDANGNIVSRSDYMPYGEEIIAPGGRTANNGYLADDVRQGFTGYLYDEESELEYAEARMYNNRHGRFTSVDPLMASARTIRPESWNRYVYCWNNPLGLVDPDGMDVQMLDEKAKERVLSTLPEEIRKQVEKQIDKNGLLKKGVLDKIKSKDANFLDLKAMVNGKGTVEVMTASKDEKGNNFFYDTKAEQAKEIRENMQKSGATEEEINETINELSGKPDIYDGKTLGADESPSGNIRVIIADGTGRTSDEPAVR